MMRDNSALWRARIFWILWPLPHSTAKRASVARQGMFTCPRGADGAFQGITRKASIGFHVADFGPDCAAAAKIRDKPVRQSAPGSAVQHAGLVHAVAAITTVDNSKVGLGICPS